MPLLFTVPQSHCAVIERLGRFARVVHEGWHLMLPGLERFKTLEAWEGRANKQNWLVELTEQQTATPVKECQTKDNVDILASSVVYWRIVDARKAVYETDQLPQFVANVALNALRAQVGKLELDEVFSERQKLNERIADELAETAGSWGIRFLRVEIQELNLRDETAAAMRQQMEAERRRRATIADAEGRAQSELKAAEAEKTAAILRAEGRAKALALSAEAEAEYLAKLAEKTSPECAARILLAQKMLDGFDRITKNPADKVFLPSSIDAMISETTRPAGRSQLNQVV